MHMYGGAVDIPPQAVRAISPFPGLPAPSPPAMPARVRREAGPREVRPARKAAHAEGPSNRRGLGNHLWRG